MIDGGWSMVDDRVVGFFSSRNYGVKKLPIIDHRPSVIENRNIR